MGENEQGGSPPRPDDARRAGAGFDGGEPALAPVPPQARFYRHSLALLTDLYQLTMAYGYWKSGLAEREAVFHLFFRQHPFDGGYALAAGLESVIEYINTARFDDSDLGYLHSLRGDDDQPLFEDGFLDYLGNLSFSGDLDAVPEGSVVFAHEPLLRIRAPLLQCQLYETPFLTLLNFQTLIATKASRVCAAAKGDPVLEFGMRRAQGVDGALSASRAAYVGGCHATSNVLAGKLYGIPVQGTHAHSWVMVWDDELEAFAAYAAAMPNNCVFLVDTYDTLKGVANAIEVGKILEARGHKLRGIRLDSGDLAHLSIEARKLLDAAGFTDTTIVASNDLDEHVIRSLKEQGAKITVWGVGTRLATAFDQPALGGVYKLAAMRDGDGNWVPKLKLSEQAIKISTPGVLQVRRYMSGDDYLCDAIFDEELGRDDSGPFYDIDDPTRARQTPEYTHFVDLLEPVFRGGRQVYKVPDIVAMRKHSVQSLSSLSSRTRRALNPQIYHVGLDARLHHRKMKLVVAARRSR